jgi:transcription elongation GreA/GreB family factor
MKKKTRALDKAAVRDALVASMRSALEMTARAAEDARAGATHEENKSEGDKDMRATEQSYLARGQAIRAEELAEQLQRLEVMQLSSFAAKDPIGAGALVRLSVDEEPRVFFVVPFGGGTELVVAGEKVTVVTPASPVGQALVGRRAGEDFELMARGAMREWVIDEIE